MKAYLANGLFSESDRMYNSHLAGVLRGKFIDLKLFLPQESLEINDKKSFADSKMIADWDTKKLLESDLLIAVIDGVEIDAGVATEIGIFSTTGKPIIAINTDVRQNGRENNDKIYALLADANENQFIYRNLFTVGTIKNNGLIVSNTSELVNAIKGIFIAKEINDGKEGFIC